ncbi:MAG: beta-1,6-N-acetylglucosaminyltransferase [Salinivirgaceae bacterium]
MHLAYIILAHKNPEQLFRLVSRLNHPDDFFFIHIDKKVDILPFQIVFENSGFNIKFITRRENGRWGDIGLVRATLNGLYELLDSNIDFTHVSLLSGQDYPIKPIEEIRRFFFTNKNKSFIEHRPFPIKTLTYGGLHRIYSYSFNIGTRRETYIPLKWKNNLSFKGKIQNLALGVICLLFPKRKLPNGWKPYYGSQWWSLSKEAVKCIISLLNDHSNYLSFHKYSLIPDEMFFQTLLLNNYSGVITNDNKRFILWENSKSHPSILNDEHLKALISSDKLFARKFEIDSNLQKLLDNDI